VCDAATADQIVFNAKFIRESCVPVRKSCRGSKCGSSRDLMFSQQTIIRPAAEAIVGGESQQMFRRRGSIGFLPLGAYPRRQPNPGGSVDVMMTTRRSKARVPDHEDSAQPGQLLLYRMQGSAPFFHEKGQAHDHDQSDPVPV